MNGQHLCVPDFKNNSSRQPDPVTIYAPVPHAAAKADDPKPESMQQRTAVRLSQQCPIETLNAGTGHTQI